MPLSEDQVAKFVEFGDAVNTQITILGDLVQHLQSIIRVDSFGPYLIDDPSGLMLEAIKVRSAGVIEGLQQALSKV